MTSNGTNNGTSHHAQGDTATWTVKAGLAQMLKGGVIMDVTDAEQAVIAQEAGACAVMALERVPSDIRKEGGVARMSHVKKIKEIQAAVSIPVMAKARIGHFVEAQILEALGIDYIDESEVLTMADEVNHIDKHQFKAPFVCGARNLGEALRRISEGAAMIRTKGEAGTGDIVEAVRHMRSIQGEIRRIQSLRDDEVFIAAKDLQVPIDLLREVKRLGKLPVVTVADCLNGFFNGTGSLLSVAESFLQLKDGGAVAVWAPTGLGFSSGHRLLMTEFYKTMFQEQEYSLGIATTAAKIAVAGQNSSWDEMIETYVFFGDPAMRLGAPAALAPDNSFTYLPMIMKSDQWTVNSEQ